MNQTSLDIAATSAFRTLFANHDVLPDDWIGLLQDTLCTSDAHLLSMLDYWHCHNASDMTPQVSMEVKEFLRLMVELAPYTWRMVLISLLVGLENWIVGLPQRIHHWPTNNGGFHIIHLYSG